ncbi:apoptosis-associated speck-like protein containing a CARD [Osmerus mordax]|uniref:apoptosis-associated speck-like protein containing a CARD n=1 Tax=Osmerus mordax TaxID=8014 RepID=UPI00350EFADF
MVYDQPLINIKGKDLNLRITLPSNSAGCSSLSGQPPPHADAVAVNNSIIHAGVIRDSTFDGDVNISVGGSPQITTGPTEPKTKGTSSILDALGFLKENRSQLVSRVKNIEPILDNMQGKGLHPEMAATVSAQPTPQLMMRKLLEATNSTIAADMLVTALLQHEPHLMEDLKFCCSGPKLGAYCIMLYSFAWCSEGLSWADS